MPDKLRNRGARIVKRKEPAVSIEDTIRADYNRQRRHAWWWNGDRGDWPNIWMSFAQQYKMPIAQIKNIVGYQGITDRPLPTPLTEDQIRERQSKRGEYLVERYHERYAQEMNQLLRQQWINSQTDWYINHEWTGYKDWKHNSYKGWGITEQEYTGVRVWFEHKVVREAGTMDEAKEYVESHA